MRGHSGDAGERAGNLQRAYRGARSAEFLRANAGGAHSFGLQHGIDTERVARFAGQILARFGEPGGGGDKGNHRCFVMHGQNGGGMGVPAPGNADDRAGQAPVGTVPNEKQCLVRHRANGKRAIRDSNASSDEKPAGQQGFGQW